MRFPRMKEAQHNQHNRFAKYFRQSPGTRCHRLRLKLSLCLVWWNGRSSASYGHIISSSSAGYMASQPLRVKRCRHARGRFKCGSRRSDSESCHADRTQLCRMPCLVCRCYNCCTLVITRTGYPEVLTRKIVEKDFEDALCDHSASGVNGNVSS